VVRGKIPLDMGFSQKPKFWEKPPLLDRSGPGIYPVGTNGSAAPCKAGSAVIKSERRDPLMIARNSLTAINYPPPPIYSVGSSHFPVKDTTHSVPVSPSVPFPVKPGPAAAASGSAVITADSAVTTSDAPVATFDSAVATSDAPVTTFDAPVTTFDAPVATFDAPVATSNAPVATSNAPVTTSNAAVTIFGSAAAASRTYLHTHSDFPAGPEFRAGRVLSRGPHKGGLRKES
jgi:hypothetical protein